MNLTGSLELTYTSHAYNPNGAERQFKVQQNGRHQARANVDRFVTNAFDDALRVLDDNLGVDIKKVNYAGQYNRQNRPHLANRRFRHYLLQSLHHSGYFHEEIVDWLIHRRQVHPSGHREAIHQVHSKI